MTENNSNLSILKEVIETKEFTDTDVDQAINQYLQNGWIILSATSGATLDNYPIHSVLLGYIP
ncbi:hypothetical protein H8F46_17045 [Xenorhabdus nematophila]|uniref:Uncharacterized protein n=2 Tax=Xenorhabdus nematophila TaxID=628 RepID=D3VDJ5_XENNA|nr:hypothetical protein [Xenorhabdus nematophila]QNJ36364.1 hypothetical protein H8F46_17045 [Xenorhabdus nematophila]CBJ92235.1 hypothetical protein XNC1_4210 [Xenorhabdus nematophila ATCC 19061]